MASVVHILCLEDDPGVARLTQKILQRNGYRVDLVHDGEIGLLMASTTPYDVLLLDYNLPGRNGLEIIGRLASYERSPIIIMVTGYGDEHVAVEALKLGASDYIVKDGAGGYLELLPAVIEQALYRQRLLEEKQQIEAALRQQALDLQARNEELDAFAHTVAHDLQSPLGLILGYVGLLQAHDPTLSGEEIKKYLQAIARSGQKMSNIIDELLLLAGVRKENVELQPLDMARIVAETRQRLAYMIEEYQAELILPASWPVALGYAPWVEEVWANYLSNGLKYGGRPPRLELEATVQRDGLVRFWIRDNGLGLTPQAQARLFTQFTQLSQIQAKGHGLGLSIVRRIVEKLGGQVGVESEGIPGRGSTFSFTLRGGQ